MDLVIFDCDGVLVESEAIHLEVEFDFLSRVGVDFERDDYIHRYMGMPPRDWRIAMSEVSVERGLGPIEPAYFSELEEAAERKHRAELVAVRGARESIGKIDGALCVASSSPPDQIQWKLEMTGLLDLFAPNLFSTVLVEKGKPAPDLFLHAGKTMGVAPERCVVVEDSRNGVIAAKSAGMTAVGLVAGTHCSVNHEESLRAAGADFISPNYKELLSLLQGL